MCEEVFGLPKAEVDVTLIVSPIVLSVARGFRQDCVTPATEHPDCVRNNKGHIVSVPGFVC